MVIYMLSYLTFKELCVCVCVCVVTVVTPATIIITSAAITMI